MSVISYTFLAFLAITIFLYYIVPKKMQWFVVLLASFYFYFMAGIQYLAVVVLTACGVYGFALLMQRNLDEQDRMTEGLDRRAARSIKNKMKQKQLSEH